MTSEQRKVIRGIIKRYLAAARANQPNIHYSQWRPTNIHAPNGEWSTDCSGLVINAFHWADLWLPYLVKDPGGYGYTGIGNTTSILATNKKRRVPLDHKMYVGDMALYGPNLYDTHHVTICHQNGTANSSLWTSHGSEAGPYVTILKYRRDLLCVVRAESLA